MQHSVYATIEDEKAKKEFKAKVMEKEREGIKAASRRCPKQMEVGSKGKVQKPDPRRSQATRKSGQGSVEAPTLWLKVPKPIVWNVEKFLLEVGSLGWQQLGLEAPRRRVISLCPNVEVLQWYSERYEQGETRDNSL